MKAAMIIAPLVLLLLLATGGYWLFVYRSNRQNPKSTRPEPDLQSSPGMATPEADVIAGTSSLFNIIAQLARKRHLDCGAVARITGKTMRAVDGLPADSSEAVFRSSPEAGALLQAVEYYAPIPVGPGTGGTVTLTVNAAARISPDAVCLRFADHPDPMPPPGVAPQFEAPGRVTEHWIKEPESDHWDPYHEHYREVYTFLGGHATFEYDDVAFPIRNLKLVRIKKISAPDR